MSQEASSDEDFPTSEGGTPDNAGLHPNPPATSNRVSDDWEPAAENGPCDNCPYCPVCGRFLAGDPIELSPEGIFAIGRRMVNRGVVLGQEHAKGKVILIIHWDGLPDIIKGKVSPRHIQKVHEEGRAFL